MSFSPNTCKTVYKNQKIKSHGICFESQISTYFPCDFSFQIPSLSYLLQSVDCAFIHSVFIEGLRLML